MQTTANLWEALCRDLESERQSAKAEQYQDIAQKFLETARQVLRVDSPRLCDAIEIAGDVYQAAGRLQDAVTNFKEAFEKAVQLDARSSAARLAAKLALLHDRLGEAATAREYYERAISLYEEMRDLSQHSLLLNQLGALCKREDDLAAAEAHYTRAMEISTRSHGSNHPETAVAANNLGVTYIDMHDFVKAENLHMQALSIRENTYGAMHPEVAQSMSNLAVVYHASGNYDKARAFYTGAIQIFERFRPSDDPEVQTVRANYDDLLVRMGKARQ